MTGERHQSSSAVRHRIPSDIDRPDRLLGNLTARQLAILGSAAVVLWLAYIVTRRFLPLAAFGAIAAPVAIAAALLALGQLEGRSADRLVLAALRALRSPRRLVVAPEGVKPPPRWVTTDQQPLPAPLRLPLGAIAPDGIVDLGPEGFACICRASSVTFALRTDAEQEALVAGFARWCNSLAEPVQLLVRAEPVDLTPTVAALVDAAPGLPHPGLEKAARDHAQFLADLAERRTLLARQVLVVLRQAPGDGAADHLRRRATEATRALAGAGVTLRALDGEAATACLARALDPASPPRPPGLAAPDDVITKESP